MQEIIKRNTSRAITVDSSGRLTEVPNEISIVKSQTALVLHGGFRSLTNYDFQRLLPAGCAVPIKGKRIDSLA
jgi:hypothetical protein